jgi:hypothetical protein
VSYTINYFIDKFEAIPAPQWTRRWFKNPQGQCDALGHCGAYAPWEIEDCPEAVALINLFADHGLDVSMVNDLSDEHPKIAIINALRGMK